MTAYGPLSLPTPTPETQNFWAAAGHGELLIQRCRTDGTYFSYWRKDAFCPTCRSADVEDAVASGHGFVYSFVINQRDLPGILPPAPSVIALVELDEGPRIAAALSEVQATPEGVDLDMRVEVRFDRRGDFAVPYFVPEGEK
jgi:uncharacterized OB-fold protein